MGGPYTGKNGAPADLRVEVRSGVAGKLEDINFTEATAPGTVFTLQNGLKVSFGAGSLARDDTFEVSVFSSVPSSVDPNKPVDGTRNSNPNFEPQFSITPGAFELNGVSIAVKSGDSITDILARITSSAAGVIASFDSGTERITLTQKTVGATPSIILGNDTSGFLAAAKLSGASVTPGQAHGFNDRIDQVPALAGIQTGSFSINGFNFQVDVSQDSLKDVLDRINAGAAGVTARYEGDRVVVTSKNSKDTLTLTDGTSFFFSGSQITPGSYEPKKGQATASQPTGQLAHGLHEQLNEVGDKFKDLLLAYRRFGEDTAPVRDAVRQAIAAPLARFLQIHLPAARSNSVIDSKIGISFVLDENNLFFLRPSQESLQKALKASPERVVDFLTANDSLTGKKGLLPSLLESIKQLESGLANRLGATTGVQLDVTG